MNVVFFISKSGVTPFDKWFNSLDSIAASKVAVAIAKMEAGNTSNIKWFDGIGEYIIDWGPGYRLYLTQQGNQNIILFCGGTKRSQKADVKEAKRLFSEYKERKKKR